MPCAQPAGHTRTLVADLTDKSKWREEVSRKRRAASMVEHGLVEPDVMAPDDADRAGRPAAMLKQLQESTNKAGASANAVVAGWGHDMVDWSYAAADNTSSLASMVPSGEIIRHHAARRPTREMLVCPGPWPESVAAGRKNLTYQNTHHKPVSHAKIFVTKSSSDLHCFCSFSADKPCRRSASSGGTQSLATDGSPSCRRCSPASPYRS